MMKQSYQYKVEEYALGIIIVSSLVLKLQAAIVFSKFTSSLMNRKMIFFPDYTPLSLLRSHVIKFC